MVNWKIINTEEFRKICNEQFNPVGDGSSEAALNFDKVFTEMYKELSDILENQGFVSNLNFNSDKEDFFVLEEHSGDSTIWITILSKRMLVEIKTWITVINEALKKRSSWQVIFDIDIQDSKDEEAAYLIVRSDHLYANFWDEKVKKYLF